jgi:sialate O-acetylesterase
MRMRLMARGSRSVRSMGFFMTGWATVVIVASSVQTACGQLRLGSTFSDNMVVQRGQEVIVWGEAKPGAEVDVRLGEERRSTAADASGRWRIGLKALGVGGPYAGRVLSGSETIELKNILSGDVWLCAGQSNMQLGVGEDAEAEEMEKEARGMGNLRLLSMPKAGADEPSYLVEGHWVTCDSPELEKFSAVAVHFGLWLARDPELKGVPIGLIDSSFGGTSAEGWTPAGRLKGFSKEEFSPSMFNLGPGALYNGMIAPLGPLGLSGVVWYQGENNSGKSQFYAGIMHELIGGWREQFGRGDVPFVVVQLPAFTDLYAGFPFTWEREAQSKVVNANPDCGLVVSIDTTNGFNLHPREKGEIGRRAALQAERLAYHEDVVADGPTFKSVEREGDGMRVTFDTHDGAPVARGGGEFVTGFAVAGEDGVFHFAQGTIEGEDAVVVRCEDVREPRFVRYAWGAVPVCDLYNSAGLPAGPFRTDDFAPTVGIEIKPVIGSRRVATELYDVVISGNGDLVSLGVDKQQFVSNDLDGFGAGNFPTFFGPRQLQNVVEKTGDSICFSDLGVRETYSFAGSSMTVRIEDLSRDPKDKVGFHLKLAPEVKIVREGDGVDLVRGGSRVRVSGADGVQADPWGGGDVEVNVDGGGSRTVVFGFGKAG